MNIKKLFLHLSLKHRRLALVWSAIIMLVSIIFSSALGLNLGLDFLGGIRWEVSTAQDSSEQKIREFFAQQDILEKEVKIQNTDTGSVFITMEGLRDSDFLQLKEKFKEKFTEVEEKSFRRVDSVIGESFKKKSFFAILFALVGIILFIAFAFRKVPASVSPWRFAVAAILALFHDILVILLVYTLLGFFFQTELNLQFITALLATLGFSVNDTIVILDRVRENFYKQKAYETFEDTINKSISESLLRSLNTSVSTLLPLFALLLFGASSIFHFILALTIGIIAGTYSSIFLAAPLLVEWKAWRDRKN